jgi:hypothetical protein
VGLRGAWLLLGLAGCYRANAAVGDPCSEAGLCPIDQTCVANLCVVTGTETDAAIGDASPADAVDAFVVQPCTAGAAWGVPVAIDSLNTTTSNDGTLRLRADELTGYFWSDRGSNTDIYAVSRPDLGSPFTIETIPAIDTSYTELDPTISPDNTTFIFRSNRDTGDDIFISTLSGGTGGTFSTPTPLTAVNSTSSDTEPFIPLITNELYFTSNRGNGNFHIYRATDNGAGYVSPGKVAEINAPSVNDGDPALSADGLTLYWRSDRAGNGNGFDIWTATRPSLAEKFANLAIVPNVNSAADDGPSWLSPDDCRMYISSARAGTNDVYVSTRGM